MAFGIFVRGAGAADDDRLAEYFRFPVGDLPRAERCVGGWVMLCRPGDVIRPPEHFATAKVQRIISDPATPDTYVAQFERGSYLEFIDSVSARQATGVTDRQWFNASGRGSRHARATVRRISPADFAAIIDSGLKDELSPLSGAGLKDPRAAVVPRYSRDIGNFLNAVSLRDRVFRHIVFRAYGGRCSVTGAGLVAGAAKAKAVLIKPCEAEGAYMVRNGLGLCDEACALFTAGMISIADDYTILVSNHADHPERVRAWINATGHILLPDRVEEHPHPRFLRWHRENRFLG